MKRTRKSDAGDKVCGTPFKQARRNWTSSCLFWNNKRVFVLYNHRRKSKLLHRSTARTQSSVKVSVTSSKSCCAVYTFWRKSNNLIYLFSFCSSWKSRRVGPQPVTKCVCSCCKRRPARRSPERRLSQRRGSRLWGDHPAEQQRQPGAERAGQRADPGVRGRRALPDENRPHEASACRR